MNAYYPSFNCQPSEEFSWKKESLESISSRESRIPLSPSEVRPGKTTGVHGQEGMPAYTNLSSQESVSTTDSVQKAFLSIMAEDLAEDLDRYTSLSSQETIATTDSDREALRLPMAAENVDYEVIWAEFANDGPEIDVPYLMASLHSFQASGEISSISSLEPNPGQSAQIQDSQQQQMQPKRKSVQHQQEKRKRQRPKFEVPLEEREYDEYNDLDVCCGRGGSINTHPGNIRYHGWKDELAPLYFAAEKQDRTEIAQRLMDLVHENGGRFMEKDVKAGRWYVIHLHKARDKCSQALREAWMTSETRRHKRQYYKYGHSLQDEYEYAP
eukprot:scaffold4216_cov146-Amphora_coffeaeformis.AAC.2